MVCLINLNTLYILPTYINNLEIHQDSPTRGKIINGVGYYFTWNYFGSKLDKSILNVSVSPLDERIIEKLDGFCRVNNARNDIRGS